MLIDVNHKKVPLLFLPISEVWSTVMPHHIIADFLTKRKRKKKKEDKDKDTGWVLGNSLAVSVLLAVQHFAPDVWYVFKKFIYLPVKL